MNVANTTMYNEGIGSSRTNKEEVSMYTVNGKGAIVETYTAADFAADLERTLHASFNDGTEVEVIVDTGGSQTSVVGRIWGIDANIVEMKVRVPGTTGEVSVHVMRDYIAALRPTGPACQRCEASNRAPGGWVWVAGHRYHQTCALLCAYCVRPIPMGTETWDRDHELAHPDCIADEEARS